MPNGTTFRPVKGPSEEAQKAEAPVEYGPVSPVIPMERYKQLETGEWKLTDQVGWMKAVNVGSEVGLASILGHPAALAYGLYKGATEEEILLSEGEEEGENGGGVEGVIPEGYVPGWTFQDMWLESTYKDRILDRVLNSDSYEDGIEGPLGALNTGSYEGEIEGSTDEIVTQGDDNAYA